MIVSDLETVHGWLGEIHAEARVPLPDEPDIDVSYDHLLRLEEMGERTYVPEGASKAYDVAELLSGVRREAVGPTNHEPTEATEEPSAEPPASSRPALLAAGSAVGLVLLAAVTPGEWHLILVAAAVAGLAGFALASWWHLPLYRRLAVMWCCGGIGVGATGFVAKAGFLNSELQAFVEWDNALTWPAVGGWTVTLGLLVAADMWTSTHRHRPGRGRGAS